MSIEYTKTSPPQVKYGVRKREKSVAQQIGPHIRRVRKKQKRTIEALSAEAGISPVFLSDIERGKKEPSVTTLRKLAKAMGVKIGFLIQPVELMYREKEIIDVWADAPTREILKVIEGRSPIRSEQRLASSKGYSQKKDSVTKLSITP